jgi:hypothetical protein
MNKSGVNRVKINLFFIATIFSILGCLTITPSPDTPENTNTNLAVPNNNILPADPPSPPTSLPTSVPTIIPDILFKGVSFSFEDSFATSIESQIIPAQGESAIPEWNTPDYYQFAINGYPLQDTFHSPRILVFPIEEFIATNPNASSLIVALQQLLIDKTSNVEPIPFFPMFNAGQFIQSQIKFVDIQNGSGIRFLTQYGQAAWPINNHDMFYAFQGISNDGKYLISAILPISHPSLPVAETITIDTSFYDNFVSYTENIEIQLNGESETSFIPSLIELDQVINSINTSNIP